MAQTEHVYAICCRPEVAGDVISGANVQTADCYTLLNFEAAIVSSFRENAPFFWVKEQNVLIGYITGNEALESS